MNLLSFRKKPPLKSHSFFTTVEHYIEIDINKLPIENEKKKRVVVAFMKIQLKEFYQEASYMATHVDQLDMSECQSRLLKCIRRTGEESKRANIPDIFIEKYNEWNSENIEFMLNQVNHVINSSFYLTNYNMMVAILDVLKCTFHIMIMDAEKTINSMNGDLERALQGTVFDDD